MVKNKPKAIIRNMIKNDIPAVSAIVCACYKWLAKREHYSLEETARLIKERGSAEAITEQRKECQFIVAEIDNKIVGITAISKNTVAKLYVDPDQFRKGIGSALFESAENIIASQGYNNILLGAFPASSGFYEAMGMEIENMIISSGGPIKGHRMILFKKRIEKP